MDKSAMDETLRRLGFNDSTMPSAAKAQLYNLMEDVYSQGYKDAGRVWASVYMNRAPNTGREFAIQSMADHVFKPETIGRVLDVPTPPVPRRVWGSTPTPEPKPEPKATCWHDWQPSSAPDVLKCAKCPATKLKG